MKTLLGPKCGEYRQGMQPLFLKINVNQNQMIITSLNSKKLLVFEL